MPVCIPKDLPAAQILRQENVFVMDEERAGSQDIRPLRILILNLMPDKVQTETQLLRLLANTPLQIQVELLACTSRIPTHTSLQYLLDFYKTFDDVRDAYYDGMIITGAPVEHLEFDEVEYWPELEEIMDWSKSHVWSTLHICWGAQAGLYHHYGIEKRPLQKKLSGIYAHEVKSDSLLFRGFDDVFQAPHSRHAQSDEDQIRAHKELTVLAESERAGIYGVQAQEGRQIFLSGHVEYDRDTLDREYRRDAAAGMHPDVPENYYPDDDPGRVPVCSWKSSASLIFSNWINYYVYQETPYSW
jgi:homoserine O-succinyltransferase